MEPLEDACYLLNQPIGNPTSKIGRSVYELITTSENQRHPIVSFCRALDEILDGGLHPGPGITELVGMPGSGKSQFCMQLCCTVQVPEIVGGLEKGAVFIDTEGSFSAERVAQMADGLVEHMKRLQGLRPDDSARSQKLGAVTRDTILENIHVFRVFDSTELLALVNALEGFLRLHTDIGLIVVDSIAFPFRHVELDGIQSRNNQLNTIASALSTIGEARSVALVVTNHMTTKITEDSSTIIPALGPSWAHLPATRIKLAKIGEETREATLEKSILLKKAQASFVIVDGGIRDVPR